VQDLPGNLFPVQAIQCGLVYTERFIQINWALAGSPRLALSLWATNGGSGLEGSKVRENLHEVRRGGLFNISEPMLPRQGMLHNGDGIIRKVFDLN